MKMENKTVIITGAAGNIGRALAKRFAGAGANLVLTDINLDSVQTAINDLNLNDAKTLGVATDISNEDSVINLLNAAEERFTKIDVLVCNAGIAGDINVAADYSVEKFDQVIAVNLRGTYLCIKHALQRMIKQGGGVILPLASIGGLKGMPGTVGYNASKFAVNGMVRTICIDHAADGIRINSICPSPVDSAMMASTEAAYAANAGVDVETTHEQMISGIPMRRYAKPDEIAAAAVFLASDDASFINGVALPVDGGMSV